MKIEKQNKKRFKTIGPDSYSYKRQAAPNPITLVFFKEKKGPNNCLYSLQLYSLSPIHHKLHLAHIKARASQPQVPVLIILLHVH